MADAKPVISLDRVTVRFGDQVAVNDLTFSVAGEEVVALLGQTGAGKSTVLNLILGQIKATAGAVIVDGCDPYADYYALRGKVAVSFQTDRLLPWRTARENVELGLEILGRPKNSRSRVAAEWLNRLKLTEAHHDKYPHQLSGGMRQRVSLARALVVDPDLILLDESFSQLDHVTSKALRTDFLSLVKGLRKTCVLVTHRIDDALEMADRIIILAVPGEIKLELTLSGAARNDPAWISAAT
ncbi:MAG: ATP-binding cassette domain-containing protein, partial [Betaproteobacteria bacterium]|nr:ATP-binding cassette domain-containing protein [Betaproteobacteria bacterium]